MTVDPVHCLNRREWLLGGLAATAALWGIESTADQGGNGPSRLGRIKPSRSLEVSASPFSVGFETLDRQMFDPERTYAPLAELGAKWARVHTGWCRTERQRGQYDFRWLDDVVDRLRGIGIQPWFCVGFGNRLYTPDAPFETAVGWVPTGTAEGTEAWRRYVAALARHYRGRVDHFEIWNEPNGKSFWRPGAPDPKAYTDFVHLTAGAIRRERPEATLIGGAIAGMETKFFDACMQHGLGDWVQKISFHSYRVIPEKFYAEDIKQWRKIIARHRPGLSLWHGEVGAASQSGGAGGRANYPWTELRQAKFLLRRFVFDLALKTELISYFHTVDLVNYGGAEGPTNKTNYKGLLRGTDYSPKPAYFAYQCLCALFDAGARREDLPLEFGQPAGAVSLALEEIVSASFVRRDRPLFAFWHPAGMEMERADARVDFRFRVPKDLRLETPVLIEPLSGEVFAVPRAASSGDRWTIADVRLADHPLFLTDVGAIADVLVRG